MVFLDGPPREVRFSVGSEARVSVRATPEELIHSFRVLSDYFTPVVSAARGGWAEVPPEAAIYSPRYAWFCVQASPNPLTDRFVIRGLERHPVRFLLAEGDVVRCLITPRRGAAREGRPVLFLRYDRTGRRVVEEALMAVKEKAELEVTNLSGAPVCVEA
ncbi:hypothetical protein DRO32_03025 [Candidatus Bathyarchaeota archaeon]|nr:MAG: hypothetical protein DRO32_03025 [Candidatus Bathyarchaeota archaeon]